MPRALALVLAVCAGLAAGPALAAGPPPKAKGGGDTGQYVDLVPVGLPVIADGRLVNYVFVKVRLELSSSANVARLRQKEPFFRDALVRAAHRTPFTLATDYSQLDAKRLSQALQREAGAIAGAGAIRGVSITSQTPRKRVAAPRA